jgi:hypothetical protein
MKLLAEKGFSRKQILQRLKFSHPDIDIFFESENAPFDYEKVDLSDSHKINDIIDNNNIDKFWPQRGYKTLIKNKNTEKILPTSLSNIALINDKIKFMEWLDDSYTPEQDRVTSTNQALEKITEYISNKRNVCVKPVHGVNGHGYWRIMNEDNIRFLMNPEAREIGFKTWLYANGMNEKAHGFNPMIVMEWLPGPEVSVDILCWRGIPLIHAARTKIDENEQRVESNHPVIEHAYKLCRNLKLNGIISVQYRLSRQNDWKILEINPRPAGGSIHSEDCGFGIITGWGNLLTGKKEPTQIVQQKMTKTIKFEKTSIIA